MTRRRLLALLPLAPAALGLLALPACGSGAAGHLTASVDVLDFKAVPQGQEPTLSVRVKNQGRMGVVLTAAVPSCVCLVVDPHFRKDVMPGEETEIRVVLASKVVPPQKLERKYLEIRSNDARMPVLMIPVRGEIQEIVSVAPADVRVGPEDAAGRGQPRRIHVRAGHGYTAFIEKWVVTQPEWFDVAFENVAGGVDAVLTVKPDPARRGGVNSLLTITIRVEGQGLPTQTLLKHVNIQGSW